MLKKLMLCASIAALGVCSAQGSDEFELTKPTPKSQGSRLSVKAWLGQHQVESDFDSDDDYLTPTQQNLDTESDTDGDLQEMAFAIQKGMFSLEVSNRTGDLDQDKTYKNVSGLGNVTNKLEQEHDDWEIKGTAYSTKSFFMFFGWEHKDIEVTETAQTGLQFNHTSKASVTSRELEITADVIQFGVGIAPQLVDTDHFNLYFKLEGALLIGEIEFQDTYYEDQSEDASAFGYFAKTTLVMEFPFLVGGNELRPFVDLGYRYQFLEPESWEGGLPSLSEAGVYGRVGLSWRF